MTEIEESSEEHNSGTKSDTNHDSNSNSTTKRKTEKGTKHVNHSREGTPPPKKPKKTASASKHLWQTGLKSKTAEWVRCPHTFLIP
jgi:hypothetical protein